MRVIKKRDKFIFILLSMLLSSPALARLDVLGWLEWAYLQPGSVRVKAKLDTGARTSSIHAINIEPFKINDEDWVRFTFPDLIYKKNGSVKAIEVEKPIIRETKIKEHIGESVSRYVVEIEFCLGGENYLTPVTLSDRSSFNYPLLLGRMTLKGNFLVDADKIFLANRLCLLNN
jgi:hypothetical protein